MILIQFILSFLIFFLRELKVIYEFYNCFNLIIFLVSEQFVTSIKSSTRICKNFDHQEINSSIKALLETHDLDGESKLRKKLFKEIHN